MGECECAAGDIDVLAREATALEQLDLSWCDLASDGSVQVGVSSLAGSNSVSAHTFHIRARRAQIPVISCGTKAGDGRFSTRCTHTLPSSDAVPLSCPLFLISPSLVMSRTCFPQALSRCTRLTALNLRKLEVGSPRENLAVFIFCLRIDWLLRRICPCLGRSEVRGGILFSRDSTLMSRSQTRQWRRWPTSSSDTWCLPGATASRCASFKTYLRRPSCKRPSRRNARRLGKHAMFGDMGAWQDDGLESVCRCSPLLEHLDLSWLTDLSSGALLTCLPRLERMRSLLLEGLKPISDTHIALVGVSMPHLRYLTLTWCNEPTDEVGGGC